MIAKGAAPSAQPAQWALVGRDEERAFVLDAVRRGRRGVLVAGAAGVGKSRLAREALASAASDSGSCVEWVLATSAAASVPFGAFAQVLAHTDGEVLTDRLGLFRATARALQVKAKGRRLLLGVDDAHLLDPGSAALLLYLVSRDVATAVVTVRSGDPWPDAIAALWKDGHVARLDLQALSEDEIGVLLEAVLGGPVARKCRRWAFERSDGYPLFLRELVAGALETGALQEVDGLWRHPPHAAPTARLIELVASRLAGLSSGQQQALELVALGEPLPLAALSRLVDLPNIVGLESQGLIAADAGAERLEVRLAHPLYGDVVRGAIGVVRTAAIRRDLADAVQADLRRPGDLLRVTTWRLDAGEAGDDPQLLTAAAEEAARVFDHAMAVRIGRAAIAVGGGLRAATVCARSLRAQEDFDGAERLLAGVEDAARNSPMAYHYLFLRVATLLWGLGRADQAEDLLARAAGWRADDVEWRHRVTNQQVVLWSTTGRFEPAVTAGLPILRETLLTDATRLGTAIGVAFSLGYLGRARQALSLLEEAMTAAPNSAMVEWPPEVMWAQVAIRSGVDWDVAEQRLSRLHQVACDAGNDSMASWVEVTLGLAALERGAIATARRWLREAAGALEGEDPRAVLPACLGLLAVAEAAAGHGPEAQAVLARATAAGGRRPTAWLGRDEMALARVWVAATNGATSRAAQVAMTHSRSCPGAPLTAAQFLHEALRVGAAAGEIAPELRRVADRTDSPLLQACAAHAEALAAGDGAALEAAARAFTDVGALLRAAEAAADAASAHERAGRAASARAAAAFSASLAGRCEDARTPRLRESPPVELSAREREVATLAARGLSNAEIAERLTLSVRTVESHLYRAATKLGVSGREGFAPLLGTTPAAKVQ